MTESGNLLPSLYAADAVGGWNLGMSATSQAMLAETKLPRGPLLELGCGGGAFAAELAAVRPAPLVIGLDLRQEALTFARSRSADVAWVQGNLLHLPFPAGAFALIVALDVVDQQRIDAERALDLIRTLLRPGGVTLLRVSAHPWLFGPHDVAFGAARRYGRREFVEIVRSAGLEPLRVTYANCLLSPAVVAVRLLQRWGVLPFTRDLYQREGLNRLLGLALQWEANWLRRRNLPWGASLFVVATRGMAWKEEP
ncbi:class I SAM-dependent methyltransferase [Caldilinea sp.]|uniref:class I SAM-dependent methyltransferase n=1 Tax=Caldilinea sp. TaxID=2293560 RepID=UPI002C27D7EC|nr:class I SAM-dependent methyltransferase [Caldilinea sp.]